MCENSSLENGLCFSEQTFNMLNDIKKYNYNNIYFDERISPSNRYFKLVLNEIYETLKKTYNGENTLDNIEKMKKVYPKLFNSFKDWISNYWNLGRYPNSKNEVIFDMNNEKDYFKAIIYHISGMTDNFAIETYNEIIRF